MIRIAFFILVCLSIISSCESVEVNGDAIEGDLCFTWLKLGSYYGKPDSFYDHFIKNKDSIIASDDYFKNELKTLDSLNLLKSPFIYLMTDSGAMITVYMNHDDYKPITKISYQDLIENEEKVRIKLKADSLYNKMYLCTKVVSIEKIEGETKYRQTKFKIGDYE